MNSTVALGAVVAVCALTILVGGLGLRLSRTTSDFYVASRGVTPWWNGAAIGGEYLSAASFLGIAGLVFALGLDMLWFPVGYTIGFVVLLVLVAAPLRRSGAYTLPDFADIRLGSRRVRALCTALVCLIGWLYLLPQLQGAGLALFALTGAPVWVGGALVTAVVTVNVLAGGMRSLTFVQGVQYWVKLFAIAVPAVILVALWLRDGQPLPPPSELPPTGAVPGLTGGAGDASPARAIYSSYSILLALCLGTMGLPHVVVRYYTNPDGRTARRTTTVVVGLLGLFYVFPPVYGGLARAYHDRLPLDASPDSVVLRLPGLLAPGTLGEVLTAVVAAGAFAAFLSTASGLTVAVAGALGQDVVRPAVASLTGGDPDGVGSFRIATVLATGVPFLLFVSVQQLSLATTVGLAFALTASTFCPLLVLGVWWRRLTSPGIALGMTTGAVLALAAIVATVAGIPSSGWATTLLAAPAAWTVPLAFAVTMGVSLLTPDRVPRDTLRTMTRLHTPESIGLPRTRL